MSTPDPTTDESPEAQMLHSEDRYDRMTRLADTFGAAGEEMRERSRLGAEVLAADSVAESADLSPATWSQVEEDVHAATTGRNGLLARSVELDADALIVRATVLTYRWIDDLQAAAYRTLGSIAGRAVGYLAPEVALGGAVVSAGLIETDALDREGFAAYLNELVEANPELMAHVTSGGGGLLDGLRMRALLTAAGLGDESGPAVARAGLRAVGAPELPDDLGAALRDVAGGLVDAPPVATRAGTADLPTPRSLEDLMTSLSTVAGEVLVQQLADDRFIVYLPSGPARGEATLRLVAPDTSARVTSAVRALETALGDRPGARVMLVGHAQGGVTAAEIAAATGGQSFVVDQVVTAGSPSAQVPRIPVGTAVLALEDRSDPVALLGSLVNARVANRLTVVFDGGAERGTSAYVAGGRAADAAGHPELRAAIRRIQELGYLAG